MKQLTNPEPVENVSEAINFELKVRRRPTLLLFSVAFVAYSLGIGLLAVSLTQGKATKSLKPAVDASALTYSYVNEKLLLEHHKRNLENLKEHQVAELERFREQKFIVIAPPQKN